MEKRKSILLAAVAVSMLMTFQPVKAIDTWTDLQQAIQAGTTPIDITGDITAEGNLGTLGGSSVTINGNGYDIDGNGKDGLRVYSNNALTINNIGLSNFTGTVIKNNNTTLISDVIFSDNTTKFEGFVHNNKGLMVINDSSFLNNKFGSSGWGIVFSDASLKVNNTSFIGNTGESTYNSILHIGNGDATIVDSIFLANTSNGNSGAINNYWCNISIIADKKDSVFTGNTSKVGSNALYNEKGVIYLNAGRGIIVFNDGIDGTSGTNNIININNTGVKMSDGTTDAPTSGIVEFNNTVSNNTVNLYNGTLKLGHYAGGEVNGKQVAESWGDFDNTVTLNLNGGVLDVLDNEIRNYTVGTLNGTGSKLALDLNFADDGTATADNFTISGGNASLNFSDINITGTLPTTNGTVQIVNGSTDNIILGNYAVFTNDASLTFAQDAADKDALAYTYNEGQGGLKAAVDYALGNRQYDMNADETITQGLGTMGGDGSTLTINGNGYDIIADADEVAVVPVYGIELYNNRTLNINNVGKPADKNSKGFNGFNTSPNGGVISNYGAVNVTNSKFSENSASRVGGVIANSGIVTIAASIFTGNSAGTYGGAIYNYETANIIANESDTTFTGNTANGQSNALYNDYGTANLNAADGHKIVFNDGIDGSNGTININNTGVTMADGTTDAGTDGIVEFNNTVKNNTVNLYNGTLKLGHYEGGTIDVNGTQQTVSESFGSLDSSVDFNVYGGTLSLQDGGARTTNIGNVTLENDLQLAIDADLANSKSDMITGNLVKANDNNIVISDVNILSDSTVAILETQVADDNLKSVVELATDAQISKEAGVNKNYLLSYDNTDGMLEFNSIVDLKAAVDATDSSRVYNMSTDENVTQYLGSMGGTNSTLTINGGGHDIKGNGNRGITVNSGQTLNVNNVGSEGSDGFNGFVYSQGGAIDNRGTATITGSTFTGNTSGRNGGAIGNIAIATITDSTFTGNLAAYGGAIFNSDNTATTTISDSTFTGNSAGYGGAIFNNLGTVNIIANESDTTFTGNTANGVSNALYNLNYDVDAVANINAAGEHRVVFNDGIDGEGFSIAENIININNTGVKMADGTTDAPTSGVVEFNNTVKNNTVNLYNGTLKLGTHTYTTEESSVLAGQTGYGSLDSSVNFNVHGGALNLQDGGARTTNIGNVTLENDLQLAIDANLAGDSPQADKITGRLTADNGHNIIISDVNIIQGADAEGVVNTVVADSNLKDAVILATDAEVTLPEDDTKSYLLAYNSSDSEGVLTFDSRDNLINAIKRTDEQRNYVMNADENVTENLGVIGGDGSTLSINGNGHNIIAELDDEGYNQYSGITVNDGQTLSINNVGTQTSQGFTGFTSENGAAIDNNGTLNITNSVFTNNLATTAGGAIYNTNELNITDSIFNENAAGGDGGAIYNDHGVVNIIASESNTEFTGNGGNNVPNALHNAGGTVNLNADEHNITFNDSISGGDSGIININGDSSVTGLTDAPTSGIIAINNEVKNNTVNMYNGTLNFGTNTQYGTLYSGTFADSVNFNYNGGTVSLQNGGINSANLGNLTLNSDMDLRLDANLANQTMDTITASGFTNNSGHNINISNILITEPTTEKSFSISPIGTGMDDSVRSALAGAIRYTGGDITYSPIYKYSASYDPATAMMSFGLYGGGGGGGYDSYNPDIFAAPVAAQLGGYLVQLNSYDNAFRNMDMYMLMTKEQRQAMKFRNKYATTNKDIVFDPTITQYENKAGWFRPYATFENVSLNNGPDVSNVAYGSFFGAESELYDLGHGWDGMWGVYAGYNGSHQAYDGVSIYQNGGTFGAVGMAYKGNFFTGLTANVGASAGDASTMFGREDFTMLMSGIASKTGYNYELAEGKFIIQPSLLMSYSFINTFDYTNAAGVSISSDPLHAIQLEPGVKFIGNLKNGWQPYASVSVIWNIMDRTHFKANDVSLPNLSVDPFVKYGVGVRKSWGERFTGFFQTYITNGGRNGVGLQAGFRWTLGKSEPKQQKANGEIPELPKTQITLNNIR